MKPLYHRGDIPVKGFALPFIEDFPSFSPQDLFILRFGYSFRQPRRNAAGSRKTIFVVCTIKTYRATNERSKTGLPRPVSCVWNVPLTPRRTAGPGPARVLVHWGETWSHPRGTLGRCLKGSEINIQCLKTKIDFRAKILPSLAYFPQIRYTYICKSDKRRAFLQPKGDFSF